MTDRPLTPEEEALDAAWEAMYADIRACTGNSANAATHAAAHRRAVERATLDATRAQAMTSEPLSAEEGRCPERCHGRLGHPGFHQAVDHDEALDAARAQGRAEALVRQHYEPQRHFFEPPDGDVCVTCGEDRDADFIRVTIHYNDGDG
jgi:hypothetical protein